MAVRIRSCRAAREVVEVGQEIVMAAWVTLAAAVGAAALGARRHPAWYGVAALAAWTFSFFAGFSVGVYTLSVAFALVLLFLGHAVRPLRALARAHAAVPVAVAAWLLAVTLVDDRWLFRPVRMLVEAVLGHPR